MKESQRKCRRREQRKFTIIVNIGVGVLDLTVVEILRYWSEAYDSVTLTTRTVEMHWGNGESSSVVYFCRLQLACQWFYQTIGCHPPCCGLTVGDSDGDIGSLPIQVTFSVPSQQVRT